MATIIPDSNSLADVQAAIDDAGTVDGDVIDIPAGTGSVTWASALTVNKKVTVNGGGTYSVNGSHVDNGDWPLKINSPSGYTYPILFITCPSEGTERARVTGIFWEGDTFGSGYHWWDTVRHGFIAEAIANYANFRIDNCKFHNLGTTGDYAADIGTNSINAFGLIDHCYHDCVRGAGKTHMIQRVGMNAVERSSGAWAGTEAWSQMMEWGGANFVFIEDCTIKRPNVTSWGPLTVDMHVGGKCVFRHNYQANGLIETHSQSGGQYTHSGTGAEIYENEFVSEWSIYEVLFTRCGSFLIYNNSFSGSHQNWVRISDTARTAGGSSYGDPDGDAPCDGNWGGGYPVGYPWLDQIGRGKLNAFAYDPAVFQPQTAKPMRIWNNTGDDGNGSTPTQLYSHRICSLNTSLIAEDRDWYYSADGAAAEPEYTAYTYPHPWITGESGGFTFKQGIRMRF
jgi:hypothetical protein